MASGADAGVLSSLPILTEEILLRHYYGAADAQFSDASTYRTSGTSSGSRKSIDYSPEDHLAYVDRRHEVFTWFLSDVPVGAPVVADLGTGHAASSAREIFLSRVLKNPS